MGLSPSTLFHLTDKKGLKGILKNNFYLSYSVESILYGEKNSKIGIPMVSFSDIKISEITDHCDKYGYYGIGLTKEWAYEKGLNPVIYQNLSSEFAINIISFILKQQKEKKLPIEERLKVFDIFRFMKQYEGKLERKVGTIEKYRFADEREWRYVPKFNYDDKFDDFLGPDELSSDLIRTKHNRKVRKQRLYFNANQVMYLIVKKDKEIDEIIKYIQDVKEKKYTRADVERLTTRIISYERIWNDF